MSHNQIEIMKLKSILKTAALTITCLITSSCNERQLNTGCSFEKSKTAPASKVESEEPATPVKAEPIEEYKPREYRIENVKKVFIHTPGSYYSVLYENRYSKKLINSGDLRNHPFLSGTEKFLGMSMRPSLIFDLFNDIEEGPGYVLMRECGTDMYIIEIHTHIENIGGGDFKYRTNSKGSSKIGTTRAVE